MAAAGANTTAARGRGRGLGRPIRIQPGLPGPQAPFSLEGPPAVNTRGRGNGIHVELGPTHRLPRHQVESRGEGDAEHRQEQQDEVFEESIEVQEARRLKKENALLRKDVHDYYSRRVLLYLQSSDENGDIVKRGLSTSSLAALRKTLETIKGFHERADENYQALRHSDGYSEEEMEEHEQWYDKICNSIISLTDQLLEQEKDHSSVGATSLNSPTLTSPPVASSERYSPSVVEPLKLNKFNGTPGTYRSFKSRFNLVMKKGRIDEGLQAEHLVQCLDGTPLRLASMIDLEDPSALKDIWKRLDGNFGDKHCDYQHHVAELQQLGSYTQCTTDSDLRELYVKFTEHLYALRHISENPEAGEDYKATLCGVLPDYLQRKVLKNMKQRPESYRLDKILDLVEEQVSLSNLRDVVTGKGGLSKPANFGKESVSPWTKSRIEAERKAHACAGRLENMHIDPEGVRGSHRQANYVTVGQETISIPGPVASKCYPSIMRDSGTHYVFNSIAVPPITGYVSSMLDSTQAPSMQGNAARTSSPWGSKTVSLDPKSKTCVFCKANHPSLDCRVFELANQYMDVLNKQGRCFNCLAEDHALPFCPEESTCRVGSCKVTIKHCHFYCGCFKQVKKLYSGVVACGADANGNFDSARMHTVLFFLVNHVTGEERLVRGFLDSGCSDTLMSKEVAEGLKLPGLDKTMNYWMSTMGGREAVKQEGSLVDVAFKSLDGTYISPVVSCVTKEYMVPDIESYEFTEEQRASIEKGGYKLSDPGAAVAGKLPVDITIGQDLYYQLVGSNIHIGDGLVLVETVFGYTLGGPVKVKSSAHVRKSYYIRCKLPEGVLKHIDTDRFAPKVRIPSAIPKGFIPQSDYGVCKNLAVTDTCVFCGESHSSVGCTLFKDSQEYVSMLKAQDRCYNCFSPSHVVYFCPHPSSCMDIGCKRRGKHSPFICGYSFRAKGEEPKCSANSFKVTVEEEQTCLKRLTDLETLGIREDDKEESPVLEKFNEEVRMDEQSKRVVIKLPWQYKRKKQLKSNFTQAFERTNNLYDKMNKPAKREVFEEYNHIMDEQVKLGILEEVATIGTVAEVREQLKKDPYHYDFFMPCHDESQIHYLPHQVVVKPSSQKIRVVYDASSKPFKQAFSLNECLETGPSLIQSLADILTRFRLKRRGYVSDITKAFLMVVVDPCDRDSLRLLWRKGDQVIIYRFNRLPFGLSPSPFVLAATLKYLFEKSDLTSEEVQAIIASFYVDDLVSSKDSVEEVLEDKEKVEKVLGEGSMELRKWNSNDVVLKGLFSGEDGVCPDVESVLGMPWDTIKDELHINTDRILKCLGNRNTKEEMYRVIAQVFDPMGLVSPYVLVAKSLFQKACLAKIDWKDKLPQDLMTEWESWKADLSKLHEVTFDRWVSFEGATDYELHGFSDASGDGLSATVYLVSKGGGKVMSRLIRCRTRVNSKKPMSMARRELCAAVLLSLVMHTTAEALKDLNITKKVYYSDSFNVLHWIDSDSYDWPPFVANRIKQIRELTDTKSWCYVNTKENPADLPSRGCNVETLKRHKLYKEGPKFLVTGEPPFLGKVDISTLPAGCRQELPKLSMATKVKKDEPKLDLTKIITDPGKMTNSHHRLMKVTRTIYRAVAEFKAKMKVKKAPLDEENWSMEKVRQDWMLWQKSGVGQ